MNLKDLIKNIEVVKIVGPENTEIQKLCLDSREIAPGAMFFAVSGTKTDGYNFIDGAIEKGATVIISERPPTNIREGITYVEVKNTNAVVGPIARDFFGNDYSKIKVVGVTGTNGKTTIATMLYQLFTSLGYKCGLLSTVENIIGETIIPATHTTGDAIQIQENISKMVDYGCEYCFMEVSSHAIDQKRISGIGFVGGIFTNLTQDHLDYHGTMEDYAEAKKAFFDNLPQTAFALTNLDDPHGEFMIKDSPAAPRTYAEGRGDFDFVIKESTSAGLKISIKDTEITSSLVGKFNAYNLTAVFAAATLLDEPKEKVVEILHSLTGVRGRMDKIIGKKNIIALVDYSHTPDALENALETVRGFKGEGKVITVFGAGGDRDKTKRPIMGEVAFRLSDFIIVTSDNPRSENPESIIADILAGIPDTQGRTLSIIDRKEAIKKAVELAKPGDIILVAGKGHEDYQEVRGVKTHFSDREVLEELL